MKTAKGGRVLALVGALMALAAVPSQATSAAAVRSDGGIVASGIAHLADNARTADVLLVVPSGASVSSDPSARFVRPWVALTVNDADGRVVCHTLGTPTAVSGGHRHANPDRVDGIGFEARCGSTTYSVHWRYRGSWLRAHPLHATGGRKVYSASGDGAAATTTVWPTEQQTSTLEVCEQPDGGPRTCASEKRIGDVVLSTKGILTVVS